MSHVLIDAATGAPVPLPYYCETQEGGVPASIHDFDPERGVLGHLSYCGVSASYFVPGIFGLAIITEEEFMRRQSAPDQAEYQFFSEEGK